MDQQRFIDRPPRIQPELPHDEVGIPAPPGEDKVQNRPIIQMLLPMITIVGYLLISVFGRGRSLIFMIPMAFSMVASVGMAFYTRWKDNQTKDDKQAAYAEKLVEMRKDMNVQHDMQRRFYLYNYPDPLEAFRLASDANASSADASAVSDIGHRLWERRSSDSDFGDVRLGVGIRPSTVRYATDDKGDFNDPQMLDAQRLAEDSAYVDKVPITISLRSKNVDPNAEEKADDSRHAIGITGTHSQAIYAFVQAMLVNYTTFHSPTDTRLKVVGLDASRNQWRWATSLPHCAIRNGSDMVFETDSDREGEPERNQLNVYLKGVRKEFDERKMRMEDQENNQDMTLPLQLMVVDLLNEPPENSVLSDVETNSTISMFLNQGKQLGGAIFVLVPDIKKIPSNCQAVIEVQVSELALEEPDPSSSNSTRVSFKYVEVGVNSPRYIGRADQVLDGAKLTEFSQLLSPLQVRKSYGADLPGAVRMMEMLKVNTIEELREKTIENWQKSVTPDLGDWLKVTLGGMSGGDYRTLKFAADADGVHGLIAGSTGSGKSELLMTMIIGLALNYDPSIVNFVLVDFKGGAAFEPFRNLPHCVDIVTNLAGSGVQRMFAAITAELNRRQAINVATDSKHIVHYRNRALHEPPYGSDVTIKEKTYQTAPYPHLFVFIDEFAEMIAGNPEYKAQLDSITRLGRALGVTLILAAQRPTGVTDQMRANIKFRIALRVETREESSEVLRRPDAAYLPTGIPGRGYLQIGNENIELIQVAWTGADYAGQRVQKEKQKVIWHDMPEEAPTAVSDDELPKVYEVMVQMMDDLAKEVTLDQRKPWPDFLPSNINLTSLMDVSYFNSAEMLWLDPEMTGAMRLPTEPAESDSETTQSVYMALNPAVDRWLADDRGWKGVDWETIAMRPAIGLVDNPYNSESLPLTIDFRRGHAIVFGASGWGKTTFIRTVVTSLAAVHSPAELHIYLLDFGGRQLNIFNGVLPHLGAIVTPDEDDRVKRLIRKLDSILEARKKQISAAGADNLYSYNTRFPKLTLPAILVAIDNFSELKESFEDLVPMLISIIRESRAYGIHFLISADLPNATGGKLFNLLTERYTLKLSDEMEYSTIVGRGATPIGDIAGRGLTSINRMPLAFQVALPVPPLDDDLDMDDGTNLRNFLELLQEEAQGIEAEKLPHTIESMPDQVLLGKLLAGAEEVVSQQPDLVAPMGIDDFSLSPWLLNMRRQGPHAFVVGPPNSGKTTFLRTLVLSLASNYPPEDVAIILVDLQQRLLKYGGNYELDQLPHVRLALFDEDEVQPFGDALSAGAEGLGKSNGPKSIFLIVDNYDAFEDAVKRERKLTEEIGRLARRKGTDGFHLILAGSSDILRGSDDIRRQVKSPRFGIAIQSTDAVQNLNGRVPRALAAAELPIGRGFVVKSGRTQMIQFASPYTGDDSEEVSLDNWMERILEKYPASNRSWLNLVEANRPEEDTASAVAQPVQAPKAKKSVARATAPKPKPKPREDVIPEEIDLNALKRELQIMGGWSDDMVNALAPIDLVNTAKALGLIKEEEG